MYRALTSQIKELDKASSDETCSSLRYEARIRAETLKDFLNSFGES